MNVSASSRPTWRKKIRVHGSAVCIVAGIYSSEMSDDDLEARKTRSALAKYKARKAIAVAEKSLTLEDRQLLRILRAQRHAAARRSAQRILKRLEQEVQQYRRADLIYKTKINK